MEISLEIKKYSRGFYFSFDAAIALTLVLTIMVIISSLNLTSRPLEKEIYAYTEINSIAEDAMQLMSYQKFNNAFSPEEVDFYVNNTVLLPEDGNLSILEVLGLLWAAENYTYANNLTKNYLEKIIPEKYNYRVRVLEETEQTIYNTSKLENASLISSAKRIISGVKRGLPRTGYVAKVSLSEVEKIANSFSYFGGYIGDGNITLNITLNNLKNVFDAKMELNAISPFELYINGNYSGTYLPTGENLSSDEFLICNETFNKKYCSYIKENNLFSFNFTDTPSYIGGGFLKISYNTTENLTLGEGNTKIMRQKIPGIHGAINLFSSFYIPGDLNSMDAFLHYKANYPLFMNIGNVTVFEKNNTGSEETIYLNHEEIMGNLTQGGFPTEKLSENTVPLRIGFKNVTSIRESVGADIVMVTDVSGSMEWCSDGSDGSSFVCTDWYSGGNHLRGNRWVNSGCEKKVDVAKEAEKVFVNTILNTSGNKVGMVDYTNAYGGCFIWWNWYYCYVCTYPNNCGWNFGNPGCVIPFPDSIARTQNLTGNNETLQNMIDSTETWWGTCTCCGVNKAKELLDSQSNTSRFRSMVVMSDGEANEQCSEQGTGSAKQDAILAAQEACNENISVYTIGFGSDADETTLKAMACNESMYYNASDVNKLAKIYEEIGNRIIVASYKAQTLEFGGNFSTNNTLYPDSYLEFNYTPYTLRKFGKISLTQETNKFNGVVESPKNFSFNIPNNTDLLDLKVTSYSSNYWTDRVLIKNASTGNYEYAYKLWDYGENYQNLGDPYIVNIPIRMASTGENDIQVDTGVDKNDTKGGSPDDRVIYTILVKGYVPYGSNFVKAKGGNKTFESELGNFTIEVGDPKDVWDPKNDSVDDAVERLMELLDLDGNGKIDFKLSSSNVNIDSLAIGKVPWMWGPAEVRLEVWK